MDTSLKKCTKIEVFTTKNKLLSRSTPADTDDDNIITTIVRVQSRLMRGHRPGALCRYPKTNHPAHVVVHGGFYRGSRSLTVVPRLSIHAPQSIKISENL